MENKREYLEQNRIDIEYKIDKLTQWGVAARLCEIITDYINDYDDCEQDVDLDDNMLRRIDKLGRLYQTTSAQIDHDEWQQDCDRLANMTDEQMIATLPY